MKDLKKYGFNTENKTFVIAEIGINHNGDVNLAKKLIDSAVNSGVDAVKFQTYITEKRVSLDSPIYEILKKCELEFSEFEELKNYSENKGVSFFSTPFDKESVDFLDSIGVDYYKIASFDVVNHKLLEKVSKTQKPLILSVGMSNLKEITDAHDIIKSNNNKIALLHCISSYPTMEKDANLAVIPKLKSLFDCVIGQSDHTNDIAVPLYAVCTGAQIIEKHFMIDKRMKCVDSSVSITETQMAKLVVEIRRVETILGSDNINIRACEIGSTQFRRSS